MPRITIRPFCVCQREGGEGGERRRECVLCECIVRGREEREVRGGGSVCCVSALSEGHIWTSVK